MDKDMLCLNKISSTTILIEASCNKSSSRSSTIFPRNKIKICLLAYLEIGRANVDIAEDARNFERGVFTSLKLSQQLIIETIVRNIINSIWKCLLHYLIVMIISLLPVLWIVSAKMYFMQCPLQILGKVNIIRKVECFFCLDFLYHVHVSLVI